MCRCYFSEKEEAKFIHYLTDDQENMIVIEKKVIGMQTVFVLLVAVWDTHGGFVRGDSNISIMGVYFEWNSALSEFVKLCKETINQGILA